MSAVHSLLVIAAITALAAGCAAGTVQPSTPGHGVELSPFHHNAHNAIVRVLTSRPEVALSLDDGPDPRWTPKFLRLLRRHGVRATFFLVGRRALRYPALVRRELRGGNEIGNHTLGHTRLPELPADRLEHEIAAGARALVRSGAPPPRLFRPPFGDFDEAVGSAVAASGELLVGWDLPLDRYVAALGPRAGARALVADARPGSIILAHDGALDRARTLTALRVVLRGLPAGTGASQLSGCADPPLARRAERSNPAPARAARSTRGASKGLRGARTVRDEERSGAGARFLCDGGAESQLSFPNSLRTVVPRAMHNAGASRLHRNRV